MMKSCSLARAGDDKRAGRCQHADRWLHRAEACGVRGVAGERARGEIAATCSAPGEGSRRTVLDDSIHTSSESASTMGIDVSRIHTCQEQQAHGKDPQCRLFELMGTAAQRVHITVTVRDMP